MYFRHYGNKMFLKAYNVKSKSKPFFYLIGAILKLVTVFSEKTDVPPRPTKFSVQLLLWPWQLGQGHKNLISFL